MLTQWLPLLKETLAVGILEPKQAVDAFNAVFGVRPGARVVVLEGTFMSSALAVAVSKVAHFQKRKTPVFTTLGERADSRQKA